MSMLWRRGIRGFCNNMTTTSSISNVLGRNNRRAKTTECFQSAGYWLRIQEYHTEYPYPRSGGSSSSGEYTPESFFFPEIYQPPPSSMNNHHSLEVYKPLVIEDLPSSSVNYHHYPEVYKPFVIEQLPRSLMNYYKYPDFYEPSVTKHSSHPAIIEESRLKAQKAAHIVSPTVVSLFFRHGNQSSSGSGTIIDPDGTILTCAHLMGSPKSAEALKEMKVAVTVVRDIEDIGMRFEGTVLYADLHYDIAIVKITHHAPLQAAKLGSSQELCLHDLVISVGRRCFSSCDLYPQFVANGGHYIGGLDDENFNSKVGRGGLFGELLPVTCESIGGCCGGPVIKGDGEVVGVMTKRESPSVYCHAISIDVVSEILEHFKKHGRVIQPRLGVAICEVQKQDNICTDVGKCVTVVKVIPGSPADRAGLLPGDIVTEIDGQCVGSFQEFINIMWDKVGKPLKMLAKRATNDSVTLTVVPDEASPDTHDWVVDV